jgi:hypothetical protein
VERTPLSALNTAKFSTVFLLPLAAKKEPAMEIAGLCLPLKPQKEKFKSFCTNPSVMSSST